MMIDRRKFLIASGAGSAGILGLSTSAETAAKKAQDKKSPRRRKVDPHDLYKRALSAIRKGEGDANYLSKTGADVTAIHARRKKHDERAAKYLLQAIDCRPDWLHLYDKLVRVYGRGKMYDKIRPLLENGLKNVKGRPKMRNAFAVRIAGVDRRAQRAKET